MVGRKMSQTVKFMGEPLVITKLSAGQVIEIQGLAAEQQEGEESGFNLLKRVISFAVESGDQLTDEDFENFPLDELSKLVTEIMKFSGIQPGK